MSDSRLNKTGLQYFYNRLKTVFASKSALDDLEDRVDDIVTTGGEPNVINTIKKNGTALVPDANKAVDITVPTKVSDLTNDSGFQANVLESIKVNGAAQTIANKAVNITVPTAVTDLSDADSYATKEYVTTNGGKIDTISVNGTTQTITNKNVNITMPTKVSDLSNDSGFQANVLESVSVNGSAQTITSKGVNITVPTAVSDLTNDSGFQTAQQVQTAISTAVSSAYKYKGSVASTSLLPSNASTGDVYDVQDTGMNYAWNGSAWDALGQLIDTSTLWTTTNLTAITTAEIDAIVV